jgi:Zn-dependent protease
LRVIALLVILCITMEDGDKNRFLKLFLQKRAVYVPYIGRIFGVRLRLHYTWLPAVVLISAAVVTQFSTDYPIWQRITLGIAASVLFLFAIIVRELVLNLISVNKGIRVDSVILFAFGGVQHLDRETLRPSLDILLAVTGMLTNLVIAGIFFILYTALLGSGSIVVHVLVQWLAFIFLMLTFLHFIPGFPLDAGRVLRSLLWKATGDYGLMTRITSWVGWSIGLVLVLGGILLLVMTQEWFTGVFLLSIGLVLQNAATHSRRQAAEGAFAPAEKPAD